MTQEEKDMRRADWQFDLAVALIGFLAGVIATTVVQGIFQ